MRVALWMHSRRDMARVLFHWEQGVRCAKCCNEIVIGEGRYNEPDGKSYHALCYDGLDRAPMTAMLTRVLEAEARRLAEVVDALVASRDDLNALEPSAVGTSSLSSPGRS